MSTLDTIYNFVQVTDNLATGGQPTEAQFQTIAQAGYESLVNLAPSDVTHAIAHEGELVKAAGMNYVQIPVVWSQPTLENWQAFVEVMEANKDKKVFVHCIANMRVSAFVMLYRHLKLGLALEDAQSPMLPIWNPEQGYPIWADFIEEVMEQEKE
ncbi:MAG: protein tyrosine phosphatase family protein [Chloroflexi bacterium]|nr:protein tyrosine phosphatase family protein [Chloroflexota bacterium]